MPGARAPSAVADGEDVRVTCGLKRRQHDELIASAELQVEFAQDVRAFHAGRPDDEFRRDEPAIGEPHAVRLYLADPRPGADLDAEVSQQAHSGRRDPRRQAW